MVAVDYWPQEEGYIVEGSPVMMCVSTGTISEGACVKLDTTVSGQVSVDHSAAAGDAIGVALRAVTITGQMVPVAFEGIVKMVAAATLGLGTLCVSKGTDSSNIVDCAGSDTIFGIGDTAGDQYILGTCLQAAATTGDEILVLLGRW